MEAMPRRESPRTAASLRPCSSATPPSSLQVATSSLLLDVARSATLIASSRPRLDMEATLRRQKEEDATTLCRSGNNSTARNFL